MSHSRLSTNSLLQASSGRCHQPLTFGRATAGKTTASAHCQAQFTANLTTRSSMTSQGDNMTNRTDRRTAGYRMLRDWIAAFATAFLAALAARIVLGGETGSIGNVMVFSALLATVLVGVRIFQHRYRH